MRPMPGVADPMKAQPGAKQSVSRISGPPPLSFTELTCQFAPESSQLTAGIDAAKVICYKGGKVELTLSRAAGQVLSYRKPWGAKWAKRTRHPHPFFDGGIIQVNQTPADYESGANYELTAYDIDYRESVRAAIDFPPGAESMRRPRTELIRAFPIVRTESAILLWIRADTGKLSTEGFFLVDNPNKASIDALAQVKGKRGDWRMAQPTPGASAFLLIDNLPPGKAHEITLKVSVKANGGDAAMQTAKLTLTAATLTAQKQAWP